MKQGKEILEKHLKEMDSSLPALDQLRMRLPAELVDLDDIYLERFLNSREGQRLATLHAFWPYVGPVYCLNQIWLTR